jgi:hypothetical protein
VSAFGDERVTIDDTSNTNYILQLGGSYTWYWGLEVRCSKSTGVIRDFDGVYIAGAGVKLINCIVHDTGGNNIGFWNPASGASGAEVYGCLAYYSGRFGGAAYNIYFQNTNGWKMIADNIFLKPFASMPIHGYAQTPAVDSVWIKGCVWHGLGESPVGSYSSAFVGKGGTGARYNRFDSCYAYGNWAESQPQPFDLLFDLGGYGKALFTKITDCRFMGGEFRIDETDDSATTVMTGSKIYGRLGDWTNRNRYPANTFYGLTRPTGTEYFLRRNKYDPARSHLVVYNWDRRSTIDVEFSGVLQVGDRYEIRDAQNYYGPPVLSGTYGGGTLAVPMTSTQTAVPVSVPSGYSAPQHTSVQFGVFVLTRTAAAIPMGTPPAIVYPTEGLAVTDSIARVRWLRVGGATGYNLQLSTGADFASVVWDTVVTDTAALRGALSRGMAYYARVRAAFGASYGQFGQPVRFLLAVSPSSVGWQEGVAGMFRLVGNYPNPFNPSTRIAFWLAEPSLVRVIITDVLGREVSRVDLHATQAGHQEFEWNASGRAAGVYFYLLENKGRYALGSMVLLK